MRQLSSEAWTGFRSVIGRVAGYSAHEERRYICARVRFRDLDDWDPNYSTYLKGDLEGILSHHLEEPRDDEAIEGYLLRLLDCCDVSDEEFARLAATYLAVNSRFDVFAE